MKSTAIAAVIALGSANLVQIFMVDNASAAGRGNGEPLITVYVESQALYYDSFVAAKMR